MQGYRVIGAEESPYSVKVRSYFRYKQIEHQWLTRNQAGELYQQHATLPLVPLIVTPEETGLQDSTPTIEIIEQRHPQPSIYPDHPVCRFIDAMLEEFADEWGNKWMFHYRWAREVDQIACAQRLAQGMLPDASTAEVEQTANMIRERMVDRVWFVGSSPSTAPQIEASFKDCLELLNIHLGSRPYLFGAAPAFSDFALWGQLYNCHRDPTPRDILQVRAPNVVAWIERMQHPTALGEFETWDSLKSSLQPILLDQVGGLFLPWSQANAAAIADGLDHFTVRLASGTWQQRPQKYHARSLQVLRQKYHKSPANQELRDVLSESGCLNFLA